MTQYIHVHNSVEVVVLFSIGWEEADSGELDIKDDSPNLGRWVYYIPG